MVALDGRQSGYGSVAAHAVFCTLLAVLLTTHTSVSADSSEAGESAAEIASHDLTPASENSDFRYGCEAQIHMWLHTHVFVHPAACYAHSKIHI